MTKAEVLKKEILRQYRSVRQFAIEMNIPYSTLVTALDRGIDGMAYGTVIKMCDKLRLNPVDFSSLERDASLGAVLLENRVMQNLEAVSQHGKRLVHILSKKIGMARVETEGKQFFTRRFIQLIYEPDGLRYVGAHTLKQMGISFYK